MTPGNENPGAGAVRMVRCSINGQDVTDQVTIGGQYGPVPNQPKTPQRTFRIPDEVYLPAKAIAADRGESLTDVIRRALDAYVKEGKA